MNRRKRQLTSLLLTLAMIVTMIPVFGVTASATDQPPTKILSVTWNEDYSVTFITDGTAIGAKYWLGVFKEPNHKTVSFVVKGGRAEFDGGTVQISVDEMMNTLGLLDYSGDYYIGVWFENQNETDRVVSASRHITCSKLDSPGNPHWEGLTATWDAVPAATTYLVWLYLVDDSGNHYQLDFYSGITEPRKDFSTSSHMMPGDKFFFQVAALGSGPQHGESETATSTTMTVPDPCTVGVLNGAVQSSYGKGTSVKALPGETVTIIYTGPLSGSIIKYDKYEFDHWEVTSGGVKLVDPNSKVTTFVMPDNNVTITGVSRLKEEKVNPFEDIFETDDYYDAVLWAYYADPQITNGMDETHFEPGLTVTRGQAVTFLWRSQGCPEPSSANNPFLDVSSTEYYYKPILWAVEKGITKGVDDTHFNPMDTLSTAHIITFLYRTKNPGKDGWDGEAEEWAETGYSAGRPFGVTTPVNNITPCPRCYVVQFLYSSGAEG